MVRYIVETRTIFGDSSKLFDTFDAAIEWVKICVDNDMECKIIPIKQGE